MAKGKGKVQVFPGQLVVAIDDSMAGASCFIADPTLVELCEGYDAKDGQLVAIYRLESVRRLAHTLELEDM